MTAIHDVMARALELQAQHGKTHFVQARALLVEQGYDSETVEKTLEDISAKGFSYCLDTKHGNPPCEAEFATWWTCEQFISRMHSVVYLKDSEWWALRK